MTYEKVKTVMGFDFGTQSIGVAVGQTVTCQANPLTALKARDGIPNWDAVKALIDEWQPDLVIVGLPLNMDGTEQPVTQAAKRFAGRIHGRFHVQVELQDERLTTRDAKEELFDVGGFRALEKSAIDRGSALFWGTVCTSLYTNLIFLC